MTIINKIVQSVTAGALIALFAGAVQANLLSDPGFESPDASGGDAGGCAGNAWDCFNSNFILSNTRNDNPPGTFYSPLAFSGTQVLKQFGVDAGYSQSVAVNPGDTVSASAYAISYLGDPFNNLAIVQLVFFDAGDNPLASGGNALNGTAHETYCDSIGNQACQLIAGDGDPSGEWTQMAVQATAPAGTVTAQLLLLHVLTDGTPDNGSLFWDNASLSVESTNAATFTDVPPSYWAYSSIETLAASGITSGCGGGNYCPDASVTRAQMAVFLERGMRGSGYNPGSGVGNIFQDVPASYWAGGWIELLYGDGITTGCGPNIYCPENAVTREQMAVFLLRSKHGQDYAPPTPTGVFNDVVLNHWSAGWIEQLAAEGITSGCGNNNYCPKDAVTRDQMAVFLVRTFGL